MGASRYERCARRRAASWARLSPAGRQALNLFSFGLRWPAAAAHPSPPAMCLPGPHRPDSGVGSGTIPTSGLSLLLPSFPSLPRVLPGAGEGKKKKKKRTPETNHLYILRKENIFVNSYSFIIMRVRSRLIKRFQMEAWPLPEFPSKPWGWGWG